MTQPLAARMRPVSLDQVIGQKHLIFPGSPLESLATGQSHTSVLLYGPPGSGKTSIAKVIAAQSDQRFVELSATSAGVAEVRKALLSAREALEADSRSTVVFVDEIHRFSKSQQDILLPAVEDGTISLIGATTENPSFAVNAALVSRSVLMILKPLDAVDIARVLRRAIDDPRGLDGAVTVNDDALDAISVLASGDVRQALSRLEVCANTVLSVDRDTVTVDVVREVTGGALQRYDRDGDQHYDVVSAFIKSMRGSDPNAALHWLARMIEAGEDPRFIARRLIVHASEDVGMADPSVLGIAVSAAQAVQLVGLPEARINLAQAVIAISTAPKSNAVYRGVDRALADVRQSRTGEVPTHLKDAHYPGAEALGNGAGYRYPHDHPYGLAAQRYLPLEAGDAAYYEPTTNGFERTVAERMAAIDRLNQESAP